LHEYSQAASRELHTAAKISKLPFLIKHLVYFSFGGIIVRL
jgi:hypothetical protein